MAVANPSVFMTRLRRLCISVADAGTGRFALSRKVDQAEGALFPGWLTRDRVSGPVWRMSPVLAARRKAGRSPGRTANQVRVGRQSATCKSVCGGRPSD